MKFLSEFMQHSRRVGMQKLDGDLLSRNQWGGGWEWRLRRRWNHVSDEWLSSRSREWQVCDWWNGADAVAGNCSVQQSYWHFVRWYGTFDISRQQQLWVRWLWRQRWGNIDRNSKHAADICKHALKYVSVWTIIIQLQWTLVVMFCHKVQRSKRESLYKVNINHSRSTGTSRWTEMQRFCAVNI